MGPRVVAKTLQFDFNRDPLYGDERMRFLLVKDTRSCKGLTLFKTFFKLFCKADINVAVLCCDGPIEDIACDLNFNNDKTLLFDEFANSISWNKELSFVGNDFEKVASHEGLLCIYSLTTLLIQNNADKIYRSLHNILSVNPKLQILAIMHSDVHSLRDNEVIESLATSVVNVSPSDGNVKFQMTLCSRNKTYGQVCYEYQLSPDFTFAALKIAPSKFMKKPIKKPDPTANLTFNLNLNDDEKEVRNQLQMPYTKSQSKDIAIVPDLEIDYYEEEDPDDDLGYLESI